MEIKDLLIYNGIKGIALDGFSPLNLHTFDKYTIENFERIENIQTNYNEEYKKLNNITLREIKNNAEEFYKKYFSCGNILYLDESKIDNNKLKQNTIKDFYDAIESFLVEKNIFDLPIKLTDKDYYDASAIQQIYAPVNGYDYPNRKIYFSSFALGRLIPLSYSMLVHEYAHILQEKNIGYTNDYLNVEMLSIFLEKLCLLENKDLLKLVEQFRFLGTYNFFNDSYAKLIINPNINEHNIDLIDYVKYVKSSLYATKLFDMYIKESLPGQKDKYIEEINDVFNGKKQVDDIIGHHGITEGNCFSIGIMKRHIY